MKQHIDTITRLLLGAAYADKRLEGAEVSRIEQILRQVLGGEPSAEQTELLRSFSPAAFNVHSTASMLAGLDPADKRKLLELIAASTMPTTSSTSPRTLTCVTWRSVWASTRTRSPT